MKYIFFAFEGEGIPIAYKLQQEGHDVVVGMVEDGEDTVAKAEKGTGEEDPVRKKKRLRLYDGMIKKVPARKLIEEMRTYPDPQNYFVFSEMNLLFKFAEQARDMGFHGNFPTEDDYCFEIDRKKAKDFVAQHYPKLTFVESQSFTSIKEAISFIQKSPHLWVAKGFDPESSVFVPETHNENSFRDQLCSELRKNALLYERSGFLLERYIKDPIEITPERIYYDGVLLGSTVCIENKPLGSSNLSLLTGCAADLVTTISTSSLLNQIAFPPIVDELAKQHKGLFFWDASLLIDKATNNIYFGEFCSNRPGYNPFFSELALSPTVNSFFENCVQKKSPYTPDMVSVSTRLFNLARTADDKYILHDISIQLEDTNNKHISLWDVYQQDEELLISGYDINAAIATGADKTIHGAVTKLFNNIDQISYGKKYYRPKFDYLSRDYPTSILNRLDYCLRQKLFDLPDSMLENTLK